MEIPFTREQFLGLFAEYHAATWPAAVVALVAGVLVFLLILRGRATERVVWSILAALWLWMGAVYHLTFFVRINPAAKLFGVLFIMQAALFLWAASGSSLLGERRGSTVLGGSTAGAALLVYPVLGLLAGHGYPELPTFGLPCPTTIFTIGVLVWLVPRRTGILLLIPVLWSIVGTSAALQLGIWQDLMLPVAAISAVWWWLRTRSVPRHRDVLVPAGR